MRIAVIGDEDTANCFRLAGFEDVRKVKDIEETKKCIDEIVGQKEFALIIISDVLANRIRSKINNITEEIKYPIIISIPSFDGPKGQSFDPIVELIRRKTGIDLKT